MSLRAKAEYLRAVHARYRQATRTAKGQILDEFCAATGYHRKSALRLLHGPPPGRPSPRPRRRTATYGIPVIQALTTIWEAAGYPWSVRLKALLPLWLPWARRRLRLSATVCRQLRTISPRQIDRRLAPAKRLYASGGQVMTEASIDPGLTRDVYLALGEPVGEDGAWAVRAYYKPYVRWIWLGALMMMFGGFVAAADRRYRRRAIAEAALGPEAAATA